MTAPKLKDTAVFDVHFIVPFLKATVAVLQTQAATTAKPGKPYQRAAQEHDLGDISGVIDLNADAFSGSVIISFPGPTFLKIVSRMLGEEQLEISKDIEDAAGEITNIVFGQAKVGLNEKGYGIKIAIPSVVVANRNKTASLTKDARMVVPFDSDAGPFFVEISTVNKQ